MKISNTKSRILALIICFVFILNMFFTNVFAENNRVEQTAQQDYELIEKRSAFEKHFQLENGHILAVIYPTQIHTLNEELNVWEEIDTSLKYDSIKKAYTCQAGDFSAELSDRFI